MKKILKYIHDMPIYWKVTVPSLLGLISGCLWVFLGSINK